MGQPLVTGDGSKTLRHPTHQETYHSTFGALTESTAVFLRNSGVSERLQHGRTTRVLEIGFGTGLNFLVTASAADAERCPLHFESIEIEPLDDGVFAELLAANFPDQNHLVSKTIDAVKTFKHAAGTASMANPPDKLQLTKQITFKLIIGDALSTAIEGGPFDALYLDAFSPQNNPALWTAAFLLKIRALLNSDARLVSYCVSRMFRDSLTEAGYGWRKVDGPPGKREVLIAWPSPAG